MADARFGKDRLISPIAQGSMAEIFTTMFRLDAHWLP
jgi:hypothetical protein